MNGIDRSWSLEKRDRERAIVRLLRGVGYTREDAWLDGWRGEGLKRRGAIKGRKDKNNEKNRYGIFPSQGRFCTLLISHADRATHPPHPLVSRKLAEKHIQDGGLRSAASNENHIMFSSTFGRGCRIVIILTRP